MHASIRDLLSMRDGGPVEARVARHVAACAHCSRELAGLSEMRERLKALPAFEPPEQAWAQIVDALNAPAPARRGLRAATVAAALAALGVALVLVLRPDEAQRIAVERALSADATAVQPLEQLIARSRELEQALQALPHRPATERASTAATLDALERRIQWLDLNLSYAPADSLDAAQSRRLWEERVELMDSLVKVRYAEAQRTAL